MQTKFAKANVKQLHSQMITIIMASEVKILYKLEIDIKALKKFLSQKGWSYRDLAKASGLSITQTYHLLHGAHNRNIGGGAATLGSLMALNIPGLFFLSTDSHSQTKRIMIDVIETAE